MLKLFAGLGFAMFLLSPGQEKEGWSELGGSSLRKNASSEKVQDKLRLIWKVRMGCPVAGHAQFTTGAGLIFGSSP